MPDILYVETTSDEAIALIEDLQAVTLARRLIENTSVEFDKRKVLQQELKTLERDLRSRFRTTVLQPDPVRVSKHLKRRLKTAIKQEIEDEQ